MINVSENDRSHCSGMIGSVMQSPDVVALITRLRPP